MPELAEVKIMSEYINDVCKNQAFTIMSFSENAWKRKMGITQDSDLQIFEINAESRGKELMLHIIQGGERYMSISCAMGMTGNWIFCDSKINIKHTQMTFTAVGGNSLHLVDMRHFARWKVAENWSDKRGPCPLTEFEEFVKNIDRGIIKSPKTFAKPICEVMMDQKWFNGIGNYLRAEILYRLKDKVNPFSSAADVIKSTPEILEMCHEIVEESYYAGGGELKDWDNPYTRGYGLGRINEKKKKDVPVNFREWLRCYQKGSSVIDSKKRRFWFSPIYDREADIYKNKKQRPKNEIH